MAKKRYKQKQIKKAMEYMLCYGYHEGFQDASATVPTYIYYTNVSLQEIIKEYFNDNLCDKKK